MYNTSLSCTIVLNLLVPTAASWRTLPLSLGDLDFLGGLDPRRSCDSLPQALWLCSWRGHQYLTRSHFNSQNQERSILSSPSSILISQKVKTGKTVFCFLFFFKKWSLVFSDLPAWHKSESLWSLIFHWAQSMLASAQVKDSGERAHPLSALTVLVPAFCQKDLFTTIYLQKYFVSNIGCWAFHEHTGSSYLFFSSSENSWAWKCSLKTCWNWENPLVLQASLPYRKSLVCKSDQLRV